MAVLKVALQEAAIRKYSMPASMCHVLKHAEAYECPPVLLTDHCPPRDTSLAVCADYNIRCEDFSGCQLNAGVVAVNSDDLCIVADFCTLSYGSLIEQVMEVGVLVSCVKLRGATRLDWHDSLLST